MELEVNKIIGFGPFLPIGNNTCLWRVSFLRQKQLNGVPQGSTLGPLNFLIYINDLANALEKPIAHHFADDTNLLYGNKNPSVLSDVINSKLKLVSDQLIANKLSLNVSKAKLLLFSLIK